MNHSMQINAGIYFEVYGFSYMLTQLLNHVSKVKCSRGEYTKSGATGSVCYGAGRGAAGRVFSL